MLRATHSKPLSSRSQTRTASLQPNPNSLNVKRFWSSHSLSKQELASVFQKNQPAILVKGTVHTSSLVSPFLSQYSFHTSQRLQDESSASSAHGQQNTIPKEQIANSTTVNFVQLDEMQTQHATTAQEISLESNTIEISVPVQTTETPAIAPASDAEIHFRAGYEHSQQGRLKEALQSYKQAIVLDSKHTHAYHWLGVTYAAVGKHRRAINNYLKSLEHAPANSKLTLETYSNLGQSYIAKQMYRESVDVMDKIILIENTNKLAHYNRGYALMMLEIFDYAVKCFNVTLRLDQSHLGSLQCLSYCLIMQRKYEEALKFIQSAEEIFPRDATLHHYKEYAYKKYFRSRGVYSLTEILNAQQNKSESIKQPTHRSSRLVISEDDE